MLRLSASSARRCSKRGALQSCFMSMSPKGEHQLHLNKGLSPQSRHPHLATGGLSSSVQVRAHAVPLAAGQEQVCTIPGCKQSVGEGLIEIRFESLSTHSGVFVLSFSKRLGNPSGLQSTLRASSH